MFNVQSVGRKIVELRKKSNMTQMELADMMGVSFQAVSNWERGNSMPDVSKLPELAEIFKVSVSEIIGEKSGLLDSAIQNKIEDYVESNNITEDEMEASLPVLKPDQIQTIIDNIDMSQFHDISSFLPFLSKDTITKLLNQDLECGKDISMYLPFLQDQEIEMLANKKMEKGESINFLLPFMNDEQLIRYAAEKMEKGESINSFLPFFSENILEQIVKKMERK